MMHILENSLQEIERTHQVIQDIELVGLKDSLLHTFGKSFKKYFISYAIKKEQILLNYSSLYSDIRKDTRNPEATPEDKESIRESLYYINETMENCGEILSSLHAQSEAQESILRHEKRFYIELMKSFRSDLLSWTQDHEAEIYGEISNINTVIDESSLENGITALKLQKTRLQSHIANINKVGK